MDTQPSSSTSCAGCPDIDLNAQGRASSCGARWARRPPRQRFWRIAGSAPAARRGSSRRAWLCPGSSHFDPAPGGQHRVLQLLERQAAPEDRNLLLAFAPVVYMDTPDRVAFGLSLEAMAARLHDQFRFVVREMPPPTQLYRGLRHPRLGAQPQRKRWVTKGRGDGCPPR
jgi:hypothetical protein